MLTATAAELAERAGRMAARLRDWGIDAGTSVGASVVGGGAFPGVELPTTLVSIAPAGCTLVELERRLREGEPSVVGRVQDERLLLDPRTVSPDEEAALTAAVRAAAAAQ
jgi:L-seryl-tRNA(Ser) seleniumtransferase